MDIDARCLSSEGRTRLIEGNRRASKNDRNFLASQKVFFNVKNLPKSVLNEYSKPECIVSSANGKSLPEGLRSEVSRFTGWVTVDEKKGMFRKNAPETEVGK